MNMGFPQSLLREVLDISIENGCKCTLKITVSGDFDNSPIEKIWDITLESIYSTQSYKIEGLPGGVELSVVVAILLDDEAYYKSNTAKVTLTEDKQISVKLSKVGSLADVSDLKAEVKDSNVFLTWTDPNIAKLFGMEVTYTSTNGSSSSTNNTTGRTILPAMETGSLFVAPGNGGIAIADLEAGTYTFTVRSMDVNGSKSAGVSVEATVEEATEPTSLDVTVSPSTTEMTNQEITVTISVTVNPDDKTSFVKDIYCAKESFTTISEITKAEDCQELTLEQKSDTLQTATFTVSENGTYSILTTAYNGIREFSYLNINNIDTTPPADPINFAAGYNFNTKELTLTWDSTATDLDHYLLSYSAGGEVKLTDSKITDKNYSLSNIAPGTTEYTFTIKAVDKAGNISTGATTKITPQETPTVSKIELSKNHFAYTEKGSTFTATISGSSFDLIDNSTAGRELIVQIVNGSSITNTFNASINAKTNTATVDLTLPTLSSSSVNGTTYTVRANIWGTEDTTHTTTFNISNPPAVSKITLSSSTSQVTTYQVDLADVTNGTTPTATATVTGTNFDLATSLSLQLYDSNGTAYGEPVPVDNTSFDQSTKTFTADITIPTVDDIYTVKVINDETVQTKTATLQVYTAPTFTEFTIPKAGTAAAGNTVTATVKGKNFTNPKVTDKTLSIVISCEDSDQGSVIVDGATCTVSNDKLMTVTLKIPSVANDYIVTITCGDKSESGKFTVKAYPSYNYAVGDIILTDGSKIDVANVENYKKNESNPPVGIVAYMNNGCPFILGLQQSSETLLWAPSRTTGYNTDFTDIGADYSYSSSSGSYTFAGDLDGSDNWDYVKDIDPTGAAEASTNYPAFNFAATYATTASLSGDWASGWYMPSVSELYEVYKNKDTIQISLSKAGGFTFKETYYWSSSQSSYGYGRAYRLDFSNGYIYGDPKYSNGYVVVIRAF